MKLLVAIPCLNEEKALATVINNIPDKINGIEKIQVLVVDDGSQDNTVNVAKDNGAKVVSHIVNKGVGVALQSAYTYAIDNDFDVMVNIDADNQFDANDIPKIIEPIVNKQADMVTASRFVDDSYTPLNMPLVKKYGNIAMSKLISHLCRKNFHDVSCGFRAYSREVLLNLNLHGKFTYTQETFLDLTYKEFTIVEVPIVVKYYPDRESRVAGSIFNYMLRTSSIIFTVYRDYYPMRFFGIFSLVLLFISLSFGVVFFDHYISTGQFSGYLFAGYISGFSLIISLALFLVGLAMGMLVRIRVNQERILLNLKKKR